MILVVNTAEETLQLVLARGGSIVESFEEACAGRMNEVMAPAVADMLARHGGGLTGAAPCARAPGGPVESGIPSGPKAVTLGAVACVRGPGSFTGVRLGLAFATGLCLGRGLPLGGLDYLPLLAASAPDGFDEVHVATHSRRERVYHQAFAPAQGGSAPAPLGPPRDLTTREAREIVAGRARSARVAVLGSGLRRNPEAFAGIDGATLLETENPPFDALLRAAGAAAFDGPPVDALYLRGSDAEENLAVIAKGRGLTEAEALARMEKALKS